MSMESSVAVMAGPATSTVLAALQTWAQTCPRAADFSTPPPVGGAAQYTAVVYGSVNYLDVAELKTVIRDAVEHTGWHSWGTVGLMTHSTDADGAPTFALLGEDGTWT